MELTLKPLNSNLSKRGSPNREGSVPFRFDHFQMKCHMVLMMMMMMMMNDKAPWIIWIYSEC